MEISKGQAAFVTVSLLAAATAGSVLGVTTAMATASKAAAIAYGVLGITFAGASIAAITAWFDQSARTADEYFHTFKNHAGVAIAGAYTFASQALIQAVIRGVTDGISTGIRRAIAGPDFTFSQQ